MKRITALCLLLAIAAYSMSADEIAFEQLRIAILNEDMQLLERQIASGLDLEMYDLKTKESLFSIALKANKERVVRLFLESGKDPNIVSSSDKETPLYMASKKGNARLVTLLLEYGASPLLHIVSEPVTDSTDLIDAPPEKNLFITAIQEGNNRYLDLCISNKFDVNQIYAESGIDPLAEAIEKGNQYAIEALLSNGIDLTIIDIYDSYKTPFALAVERYGEDSVFVKLLRDRNAHKLRYPFRADYQATVLVDRLRIRKIPSLNGEVIGFLMKGDTVEMKEVSPTFSHIDGGIAPWIKISHESREGWVYGVYLDAHLDSRGY